MSCVIGRAGGSPRAASRLAEQALDAGELLQDLGVAGVGGRDRAPQILEARVVAQVGEDETGAARARVLGGERSGVGRRLEGRALALRLAQALAELGVGGTELLQLRGEGLLHGRVALLGGAELLVEDRELPLEGADLLVLLGAGAARLVEIALRLLVRPRLHAAGRGRREGGAQKKQDGTAHPSRIIALFARAGTRFLGLSRAPCRVDGARPPCAPDGLLRQGQADARDRRRRRGAGRGRARARPRGRRPPRSTGARRGWRRRAGARTGRRSSTCPPSRGSRWRTRSPRARPAITWGRARSSRPSTGAPGCARCCARRRRSRRGTTASSGPLLAVARAEAEGYKIWLQIAAALGASGDAAAPHLERAAAEGAPAWALAWARALSERRDGAARGAGGAALRRRAAGADGGGARPGVEGAVADAEAMGRYAGFAHGRDCIRRFGARAVADVLEHAVKS